MYWFNILEWAWDEREAANSLQEETWFVRPQLSLEIHEDNLEDGERFLSPPPPTDVWNV